MGQPLQPNLQGANVKAFAHGEPPKTVGTHTTELTVELADGVIHHHLGGAANEGGRWFRVRYAIGPVGELTVWSVGGDPGTGQPENVVKRVITYGPHGWVSLRGPATPFGYRQPEPKNMLRDD